MKNPLSIGIVTGFLVSAAGVAVWLFSQSENEMAAYSCWLLPATFLVGVVLTAVPELRRLGTGLAVGSLAVAAAVYIFVMMLAAQIGS